MIYKYGVKFAIRKNRNTNFKRLVGFVRGIDCFNFTDKYLAYLWYDRKLAETETKEYGLELIE